MAGSITDVLNGIIASFKERQLSLGAVSLAANRDATEQVGVFGVQAIESVENPMASPAFRCARTPTLPRRTAVRRCRRFDSAGPGALAPRAAVLDAGQ